MCYVLFSVLQTPMSAIKHISKPSEQNNIALIVLLFVYSFVYSLYLFYLLIC